MRRLKAALRYIAVSALRIVITLPWLLAAYGLRFLYRFRLQGNERMPQEGPLIVLFPEIGVVSNVTSTWAYWQVLRRPLLHMPDKVVSYAQEQLWALPYLRLIMERASNMRPLVAHSAGPLALHLLDGYRALREGGIVIMNPEGDMPWDGRPLALGGGAAWLALRTAAPIVPLVWNAAIYDIWPRWRMRPWLRGRPTLTVGEAFRLCDTPMVNATQQDVDAANARIRDVLDRLTYGAEGIAGWMGAPTQGGVPLSEAPVVQVGRPTHAPRPATEGNAAQIWHRGIAQLFWRCPVCGALDAVRHDVERWVHCTACDTRWEFRRVPGKDFRLRVVEGPAALVDLEMSLSAWYDRARELCDPEPIPVEGVSLAPDEHVYLWAEGITLAPAPPNPLIDRWDGREPPDTLPPARPEFGRWVTIDHGRLYLTERRLLWQGERGELDFHLDTVRGVSLWLVNTLGLIYGSAPYRFGLGSENGLKWLTHVGAVARQSAQREGHRVTVSAF